MLCPQCTSEHPRPGPYCAACGASLTRRRTPGGPLRREPRPVLCLRATLVPRVVLAAHFPVLLFLVLWGTAFLGGSMRLAAGAFDLPLGAVPVFSATALVLGVLAPLVTLACARRSYATVRVVFLPSRVRYLGGILGLKKRSLPLADVLDVELERSRGQVRNGLGSIVLRTRTVEPFRGDRIRLDDVRGPEEHLARITDLLQNRAEAPRLRRDAA